MKFLGFSFWFLASGQERFGGVICFDWKTLDQRKYEKLKKMIATKESFSVIIESLGSLMILVHKKGTRMGLDDDEHQKINVYRLVR